MKISELNESTFVLYHGSKKMFPVGFVLEPQSDGYVQQEPETKSLEAYIEKYRPKHMIPRNQAVFMCHSIDDIDYAGGYLDNVYRVKPIGKCEKHNLSWYSHLQTFLGGDDERDPKIQAEIKQAALNYWLGKPFIDRESTVWEYLARKATIYHIEDVDFV